MDAIDKKYHHFSGEKYKILKKNDCPFFSVKLYPPAMKVKVRTFVLHVVLVMLFVSVISAADGAAAAAVVIVSEGLPETEPPCSLTLCKSHPFFCLVPRRPPSTRNSTPNICWATHTRFQHWSICYNLSGKCSKQQRCAEGTPTTTSSISIKVTTVRMMKIIRQADGKYGIIGDEMRRGHVVIHTISWQGKTKRQIQKKDL